MAERPAPVDVEEEKKPKPSIDEQLGSSDRLSNADYWLKRNKSPKHDEMAATMRKENEKTRERKMAATPSASTGEWVEKHAAPRGQRKKFTEEQKEKAEADEKRQQSKLTAQPSPETQEWVDKQQPKSLGKRFDSDAKQREADEAIQKNLSRKPNEATLDWCDKQALPRGARMKHFDLVQKQAADAEKAKQKRLAAKPSSNAVAWISEKSAPVERASTTLREWPEWGKDPKWNKKKGPG